MDNDVVQLTLESLTQVLPAFLPHEGYIKSHKLESDIFSEDLKDFDISTMAQFVFGDLKNCKVIINGSAAAGSKRKFEEDNDNSTILLTLRESVRNLIPFVIHLIESGA